MPASAAASSRAVTIRRLVEATRHDQAAGVTLSVACVGALVWANWPSSDSYADAWQAVAPWSHALGLDLSWRDWVNQGLMLGFFGMIGLEIRREVVAGELRSWRRASVPVLAALGGMVVPALLFAAVTAGGPGAHGWGIPVATDVAFALGALALLGGGGWPRARVFLMTLAVADDIFSIVVLVVFYPRRIDGAWLGLAIGALVAMAGVAGGVVLARRPPGGGGAARSGLARRRLGRARAVGRVAGEVARRYNGWLQLILGAVAWWALLHAGVEAAVVGVAVGALAPRSVGGGHPAPGPSGGHPAPGRSGGHPAPGRSGRHADARLAQGGTPAPAVRAGTRAWELRLTPVVNAGVLPVFALANSGVRFAGAGLGQSAPLRVFIAVLVARVIGKPVGIYVTTRLVRPRRGPPIDRRRLLGVGATASVGFTVPLLVINAALPVGPLRSAAIAALLAGSVLGVVLGGVVLVPTRSRARVTAAAGRRPGSGGPSVISRPRRPPAR